MKERYAALNTGKWSRLQYIIGEPACSGCEPMSINGISMPSSVSRVLGLHAACACEQVDGSRILNAAPELLFTRMRATALASRVGGQTATDRECEMDRALPSLGAQFQALLLQSRIHTRIQIHRMGLGKCETAQPLESASTSYSKAPRKISSF